MAVRSATTAGVALALAVHAGLSLWSASRESATFDEVPHIAAGYSHLVLGDFHLDPGGHPPLMKLLAAAALLPLRPELPLDDPSWAGCIESRFGTAFLYRHGDGRKLLFHARAPFVLLGAALGLVVFLWARELWGTGAAWVALGLYVLNPEILAHSHYANSDVGITLFTALFLRGLWRFLDRPSAGALAWTAGAFAAASVTKYSFPLLLAMGGSLAASRLVFRVRPAVDSTRGPGGAWSLLRHLTLLGAATAIASFVAIWAVHGFRAAATGSPELACAHLTVDNMLAEGTVLRSVLAGVRDHGLLPEAYLRGIAFRAFEGRGARARPSFVAGKIQIGGTWTYFPLAFLLKTPLPLLLLLGLAVALSIAAPDARGDRRAVLSLVAPALVYFALAIASGVNLGYRHLLPILPLLIVLAGRSARILAAPRGRLLLAALLLAHAVGTARVAPHFLSYFNLIAGGPEGGNRYLVDSNCDWGQDLDELVRLCRREGIERVKLSYFGNASPDALGLPYTGLPSVSAGWSASSYDMTIRPGDVIAISVTNLRGVYFDDPARFPATLELPGADGKMGFGHFVSYLDRRYRPAARAGYSILVYRLEPEYERARAP